MFWSGCAHPPLLPPPAVGAAAFLPRTSPDDQLVRITVPLDAGHSLEVFRQKEEWGQLAVQIAGFLQQQHLKLKRLFGPLPPFTNTLMLMDRSAFQIATGSPQWVNAVSHQGRIYVPLGPGGLTSKQKLLHSLSHEYMHAAVHALSAGRCPGWIDEGLAQWFSGSGRRTAPAMPRRPAAQHPPIPLSELQHGFLDLGLEKAKAAYGQSLYAVQDLLITYGVPSFGRYFALLRRGAPVEEAFLRGFGLSLAAFERRLAIKMKRI